MSLKQSAVKGSIVTVAGQAYRVALRLGTFSVMAHFLSPDDYGLVAIVYLLSSAITVLRDAGFSEVTLQKPNITQVELSSMYWINVVLGVLMVLVLSGLSPILSWAFEREELIWLTIGYSLVTFMTSFNVQRSALMRREMDFSKLVKANVISHTLSSIAGIVSAIYGLGYWSLLVLDASNMLIYNLCLKYYSTWKPDFKYDHTAAKPLIRFGTPIMFSNVLLHASVGLDAFILGYFHNTREAGVFNRAVKLLRMPLKQSVDPIMEVAHSWVFRKAESDKLFSMSVYSLLSLISLLSALILIGSLSFSEQIVSIMLGNKWDDSLLIYMALTPYAFIEPCVSLLSIVILSKGKSKPLLYWQLVSVIIITASILVGVKWGGLGVAISGSIAGLFVRMPLFLWYACKTTKLSLKSMLMALMPSCIAVWISIPMAILAYTAGLTSTLGSSLIYSPLVIILFILIYVSFPGGRETIRKIRHFRKPELSPSEQ